MGPIVELESKVNTFEHVSESKEVELALHLLLFRDQADMCDVLHAVREHAVCEKVAEGQETEKDSADDPDTVIAEGWSEDQNVLSDHRER